LLTTPADQLSLGEGTAKVCYSGRSADFGASDAKAFATFGSACCDHFHVFFRGFCAWPDRARVRNRHRDTARRGGSTRSGCVAGSRCFVNARSDHAIRGDGHQGGQADEEEETDDAAAGDQSFDRNRHRALTLPQFGAEGIPEIHSVRKEVGRRSGAALYRLAARGERGVADRGDIGLVGLHRAALEHG